MRYPHHDLDRDNPHLQAALARVDPDLRAAFIHFLETNAIPPELTDEQLGRLLRGAAQAEDEIIGDRDMLYLPRDEYRVVAALTRMVRAIAERSNELRPDQDIHKLNAWVDALPPDASPEETDRLYRKIVLGEED